MVTIGDEYILCYGKYIKDSDGIMIKRNNFYIDQKSKHDLDLDEIGLLYDEIIMSYYF